MMPDVTIHWRNTSTSSLMSFEDYAWAIHHSLPDATSWRTINTSSLLSFENYARAILRWLNHHDQPRENVCSML
jgi:hypothetical protein